MFFFSFSDLIIKFGVAPPKNGPRRVEVINGGLLLPPLVLAIPELYPAPLLCPASEHFFACGGAIKGLLEGDVLSGQRGDRELPRAGFSGQTDGARHYNTEGGSFEHITGGGDGVAQNIGGGGSGPLSTHGYDGHSTGVGPRGRYTGGGQYDGHSTGGGFLGRNTGGVHYDGHSTGGGPLGRNTEWGLLPSRAVDSVFRTAVLPAVVTRLAYLWRRREIAAAALGSVSETATTKTATGQPASSVSAAASAGGDKYTSTRPAHLRIETESPAAAASAGATAAAAAAAVAEAAATIDATCASTIADTSGLTPEAAQVNPHVWRGREIAAAAKSSAAVTTGLSTSSAAAAAATDGLNLNPTAATAESLQLHPPLPLYGTGLSKSSDAATGGFNPNSIDAIAELTQLPPPLALRGVWMGVGGEGELSSPSDTATDGLNPNPAAAISETAQPNPPLPLHGVWVGVGGEGEPFSPSAAAEQVMDTAVRALPEMRWNCVRLVSGVDEPLLDDETTRVATSVRRINSYIHRYSYRYIYCVNSGSSSYRYR